MDTDAALERAPTRTPAPPISTDLKPAPIIRSDEEAVSAAHAFAASILPGASNRDREGRHPFVELIALRATGLLGITVAKEFGGAQVSHETVADIFRILAAADPSIAQIPQSHFGLVKVSNT